MTKQTVLVVGGCGFVGHHVLRALQSQQPDWALHSLSRSATRNLVDNVEYHLGSILSHKQVLDVLRRVAPTVVIHTASPPVVGERATGQNFYETNVDGTACLVDCARAVGSVKAFVFTSSVVVTASTMQRMATEDAPVKHRNSPGDEYSKSKAIAEDHVLKHSGVEGMLTASLRLPAVYGERDEQNIAKIVSGLRSGEYKVQIGDNTNLVDWCSATNAARAHVLATLALLREHDSPRRDGESAAGQAFFITDGDSLPFWDFIHLIWNAAGTRVTSSETTQIPPWLIMSIAAVIEAVYWIFSLGTMKPEALRRDLLKFTFVERTFCINKARRRLGYSPAPDRQANIEAGVAWFLSGHPEHRNGGYPRKSEGDAYYSADYSRASSKS